MNEHSDMHYIFSTHQPSTMNTRECNYDIYGNELKNPFENSTMFYVSFETVCFTSSNALETTCLSRTGMYLIPWGTVVGAKASMMVSRLATKPWVFNQRAEDISRELEKRDYNMEHKVEIHLRSLKHWRKIQNMGFVMYLCMHTHTV